MKKNIAVGILFLISIIGYSQSDKDVTQIVFATSTRGYSKQVIVDSSHLEVKEEGSRTGKNLNQSRKLMKKEWSQLCKEIKSISIVGVPELKSPTMKRASDAAMGSTITLTLKDGNTVSHDFDNENPHEKLQGLLNAIIKLTDKEKGR